MATRISSQMAVSTSSRQQRRSCIMEMPSRLWRLLIIVFVLLSAAGIHAEEINESNPDIWLDNQTSTQDEGAYDENSIGDYDNGDNDNVDADPANVDTSLSVDNETDANGTNETSASDTANGTNETAASDTSVYDQNTLNTDAPTLAPVSVSTPSPLPFQPPVGGSDSSSSTSAASSFAFPKLPLGDINVLVSTDVHSWVGGHGANEPYLNVDYGAVLSFYQRLQEQLDEQGRDLFFVDNGDWIDGTGISMNGNVFALTQVLEQMPWDALNVGNHELYRENVVEYIQQPGGFIDFWNGAYLSSNIVRTDTMKPIGQRYKVLRGKRASVLTFAFLYDMKDNVKTVTVKQVESVVQEPWFAEALHSEKYDAILVLAHMHFQDPLVTTILTAIRKELGKDAAMPVQFITGHTHIREYAVLDEYSTSFEAGRFLDTLGFVSFPTQASAIAEARSRSTNDNDSSSNNTNKSTNISLLFQHRFLDADIQVLQDTLGVETLDTPKGLALSSFIHRIQDELGLSVELGCVDKTYYVENGTDVPSSLWGFFNNKVVPTQFSDRVALLLGNGEWRYDLVEGRLALGDVIAVAPFNESLYIWEGIPSQVIFDLNQTINAIESNETKAWVPLQLPPFVLSSAKPFEVVENRTYDLVTGAFDLSIIMTAMSAIYPEALDKDPTILDNVTSTSVWINYIRDHSPCLASSPYDKPKHGGSSQGDNDLNKTNTHHSPFPSSSNSDAVRLGFVFVAIGVVIVLASINIWQRSQHFHYGVAARERSIIEALDEYNDGDANDGDLDESVGEEDGEVDEEAEEGQFV